MVDFDVDPAAFEASVTISGMDMVWALSRGDTQPLGRITAAAVVNRADAPFMWRAPGTGLPGVIMAGTFRRKGRKELWFHRKAERLLRVEFDESARFDAWLLEVADPEAALASLGPAPCFG